MKKADLARLFAFAVVLEILAVGFLPTTPSLHVRADSGPSAMPLIGSTEGSVAGPTSIVVSGLPTNLTTVVVTWWNGNTSFDNNVGSYGSYGMPSEYYIEASVDGSTWIALTHVTGNQYNGRQFAYNFTGTGYTQVRLRVVSLLGSYAGQAVVTVHRADNGTGDSYLLLGDSITSNCWAAANDAFPIEQLGTRVNANDPSRFPVVTEGGIPGLTSASPLSTSPYSIPVIQQWLNDFPTVQYVALSYGTNDANGNIPAATYYANMQAMVQAVIAAGKIPIIPTIVASPSAAVQANAPGMNAEIATLESQFPSIIKGPDLWSLFSGHSVSDGWFFDDLHPSLTTGCDALQNAWASTLLSTIYGINTSSTPPSVPAGLSATAVTSTQVNLAWNASSDPNYDSSTLTYTLYRNGVGVVTTAAGTLAYSDTGVAASTTYTYTITASDPGGNSSTQSAGVSVTTPASGAGGGGGGSPPTRVQGCAAEAGSYTASCTLSAVKAGDEIVIAATSLEAGASTISFSDNCGGKYTVLNTSNASSNAVAQGYGTGSSGTCTVTARTAGGWATTLVAEEITPGVLDVYGWTPNTSVAAGSRMSISASTATPDYLFSWAADEAGDGGSHMTTSSPFTFHDFNNVFPIVDGDAVQSTSGAVTATWTFNTAAANGVVGLVAFAGTGGSGGSTAAPAITSILNDTGTVGAAFSYQITATNNPVSYSAGVLPPGLSLNTSTGLISGTPTSAGTSTVTINAINAGGTGSATLTITIVPAPPAITSSLTASGTVGISFTYQITGTNNPTSYSASGLPSSLSLNTTTGLISGTPAASGTVNVVLEATNAGGTGTATLILTIKASNSPPSIPTGLSATAVTSSQVSLAWNASSDPSYASSTLTYTLYRNGTAIATTVAGALAYTDTGVAGGTTYTYTISAADPAGNSSAQSAGLSVTTPGSSGGGGGGGTPPTRVQGCAAEAGSHTASCTLSGVKAGDEIVIAATSLEAGTSPVSFSDNCGGTYSVLDSSNASSDAVAQGYGTGSSGTCTVTAQTAGGWATTLVAEEITPGVLDVHGWQQNFAIAAGKTSSSSAITNSNDYVFSWATDEAGDGGSHMTTSSPFTAHDFSNVFPIVDADAVQSTSGTITVVWKFNTATSHGTVGLMAFKQ